ncbi:MAG: NAD-glutamate dehydrogenase [Candidatus Delongbacteria bacterium]|nr:NAD-glutamate dehydrogenase [Candidatus Delongbacteria bacterium]
MKTLKEIAERSVLTEEQLEQLEKKMKEHQNYTERIIREEIEWFCAGLGMNDYYFKTTPMETIAGHIEAIKAAEIISAIRNEKVVNIDLATELENEAIYLVDDNHNRAYETERRIENKYLSYRLQSYRTLGKTHGVDHLRMYLAYKPSFPIQHIDPNETDLRKIADISFLSSTTEETFKRYQEVINRSKGWETPLIDTTHKKETNELRIMIAVNTDSNQHFFSNVSDVINSHRLVSNRKYIEHFANGKTIYAIYVDDVSDPELITNVVEDISLVYVIPECPLSPLFREGKLNAQETVFAYAAWGFAHQFLSGYNEEYIRLSKELEYSPELMGILRNMKTKLAKDTYTESKVWDTLIQNSDYIRKAFTIFDRKFNPDLENHSITTVMDELKNDISRNIKIEIDNKILLMVLKFIEMIQRTNFYYHEKTSIAFSLSPDFLNPVDYPEMPFGIMFILGSEFRGFHIRFRDIARGGIRIVKSPNVQSYLNNSDFIFDENYNLALTQQRKNKDIPEGGSKGTILLRWGFQDKAESAFKKYVDGLLDLILSSEKVVDYYGKPVILFLGPDEHTAELMEWAALRGRKRRYAYWKAFSTGKPVKIGGIPHDLYGMTTNSVHQYVVGTLEKLQLDEAKISKVMTGGPDGDLGSNEILISNDKIMAIVDGSGVLFDPQGIDRPEMTRLAKTRQMIKNYDRAKLSAQGFIVTTEEQDITLPNGEKVVNGMEFRNTFHLHPLFKADLFVPCGGRPASININNWTRYLDDHGNPRFKIIIEGANLFITQDARLRLEEKGVILYKDASANKGGVTSSSMEVYASLALTDEEYNEWMCVVDNKVHPIREQYVNEILDIIKLNAAMEFEAIWKENLRTKTPRAVLTDLLSNKINQVTDAIYQSNLDQDKALFRKVIQSHSPKILVEKVGLDNIFKRVPETYLKSILASRLASQFVYKYGLQANEIDFFNYLKEV